MNIHSRATRRFLAIGALLALIVSSLPAVEPAKPGPWNPEGIDPFEFTDQFGKTIKNDDLKGKPWIVGFVFTRCLGPCPTVSLKMKEIRDQTGVKTVTVTVDPDFDTQEILARYATNFIGLKEDDPDPWLFLRGDKDQTYQLIKDSFLLPVEEMKGKNRKPGWEVLHSTAIVLVNSENQVVAKFNAQKDEEVAKLRRILQEKDPFPPPPEGDKTPPEDVLKLPGGGSLKLERSPDSDDEDKSEEEAKDQSPQPTATPEQPSDAEGSAIPAWALKLPAVNATLNGAAAFLLILGYLLIKLGKRDAHRNVMLAAFGISILFLASYLVYHYHVPSKRFEGSLSLKLVYYPILLSHVLLAVTVPFLAGRTIFRAFRQDWTGHKRIARITYPIWIYVSVTGVIIYLMLYQLPTG